MWNINTSFRLSLLPQALALVMGTLSLILQCIKCFMCYNICLLLDYSNLTFQSKSSFKSTRLYHMVTTLKIIIINHADTILGQTSLMLYVRKVVIQPLNWCSDSLTKYNICHVNLIVTSSYYCFQMLILIDA